MADNPFKKALFSEFARVAKALGNGNRLELLEFLAQRECSVEELAKSAGLRVGNTSQHLQQLRQAGLVVARKQGLKVFYRLRSDEVVVLLQSLRKVAEQHIAEVNSLVDEFLRAKDQLAPMPREELLEKARAGLVTVLDVRPPEEYRAGHLPGAVNVPLQALQEWLDRLDPAQEVVAYCRGPHCVLAYDAVMALRQRGFQAQRLQDGFPEWKSAGLPVERG